MEGQFLRDDLYQIAFLEGDTNEMRHQVQATAGKASIEDILLSAESDTHAYYGRLAKARDFSRRASQLANLSEQPETAALWLLNSALREAEFGNLERARQDLRDGLALAATRVVQTLAALALACSGDLVRARAMADALQKEHPLNTMLNRYWLPTIRAYIEIHSGRHAQAVSMTWLSLFLSIQRAAHSIPATSAGRLISVCIKAKKPPPSSRNSSTTAPSSQIIPSPPFPASASRAPMPLKVTPPKQKPPTRTSSPCGKTPTPTSPS